MRPFLLPVLLFCLKSAAQQYVPLPLSNCYWLFKMVKTCTVNYQPQPQSEVEYKIFPAGDTNFTGSQYTKLYIQEISSSFSPSSYCLLTFYYNTKKLLYYGAIRQDTAARKIFFVNTQDTTEKLLYDFNLKAGDSVITMLGTLKAPYNDPHRVITNTYYQSYSDGVCRKTFDMKPYLIGNGPMTTTERFTEGIGNEHGLVFNYKSLQMQDWPDWSSFETWTSRFFINDVEIVPSAPNNCVQDVGLTELVGYSPLTLYPNPASTQLLIKHPGIKSGDLIIRICDITGSELLKTRSAAVDISSLPAGCYQVILTSSGPGEVFTSRFVKQ